MTVTLPVEVKEHDRVEVPEPPVTLVGVNVHAALSLDNVTVAVKLLRGVMVIIDVPAEPTTTLTAVGLAAMLKSGAAVTE